MNIGLTFTIGARDMATKVLKGVGSAIRDTFVFAGGNLLAGGIVKVFNGMRSLVDMTLEAEAANTALDSSLRGLGIYTPKLAKQFNDLASAIQNETGVSDEATKRNIAQLLTLGVMPEKIGFAARAIQGLTAVGRDNQSAMLAVGKMLEGDLSGFERLSPAVKNATTDTEKFAAIQKMLAGGYEQQQANLQTVGGAWEALKGRIGDAIESIGLAIIDGAGLGKTFGDMQAKVGAFLEGSQWNEFLKSIESGAKFAKEIGDALVNQGGIKESFTALGDLIKAAFIEGANAAGEAFKKSLGNTGIGQVFGGISDVVGGIWNAAGEIDKKIGTAEEFFTGRKVGYSDRGVAERERQGKTETVAEVLARIKSTASTNKTSQSADYSNPLELDPSLMDAYKRDMKNRESKKKQAEDADMIAQAAITKKEKDAADELIKKKQSIYDQLKQAEEAKYQADKQQRTKNAQEEAKIAEERYKMLMSEFMDPSKRTARLQSEQQAADVNAQIEREYAEIQRKQGSMFGLRGPSDREQQVIDLVNARTDAKSKQEDYAKITADSVKGLAEKIDNLLKIRQRMG
jgi:hypothetical protein